MVDTAVATTAGEGGFRNVVTFLDKLGVYDIILPFLLIFTIVFAILEKTKVLGLEKVDGKEYTKKNLNAMVAFISAFLVIASTRLISVINQVLSNVVLLLILGVCFLLLVGVFFSDKEFSLEKFPGWIKFFMVLMFLAIVVIFLNAMDWLQYVLLLFKNWDAEWAVTLVFVIIIIGFMWYVVSAGNAPAKKKEEEPKK